MSFSGPNRSIVPGYRSSLLLSLLSVAAQAQDAPVIVPSPAPAAPRPLSSRPPSSYASSPAPATSAIVHEQAASFWEPLEIERISPFRWGPFQIRPFADYRYTYGNGLNAQPGQQENTALHRITPGITASSKRFVLTYSPSLSYYSNDDFNDSLDHLASVSSTFGYEDWVFGLNYSYSKTEPILIETGQQTPTKSHTFGFTAHYQYSDKTSYDFSLSRTSQKTDLNDLKNWSSMNWLNYHFSDKTTFGVGAGAGFSDQTEGSNSIYEQIQGRIGWRPGPKLTLDLNGGVEFRQFMDSAADDDIFPLMGLSINYALFESTVLQLSANQSVGSSLLDGQITENTSVSAGFRQRLLRRLNFDLFARYGTTDYQSTTSAVATETRSDEFTSISASLGATFREKGTISVFYERSKNNSSAEGLSYTSDQYGVQIGYRF